MNRYQLLAATLFLTSCATSTDTAPVAVYASATTPADKFYQSIAALCGQSFASRIVANTPASTTPDPFEGKALVMHVRECGEGELRIT